MAPPVPPPPRDSVKDRLLAWKLGKEASEPSTEQQRARSSSPGGSAESGSWSTARADADKQRILRRRREIMAAPSLADMKSKYRGGLTASKQERKRRGEMEVGAEEAARDDSKQAAASGARRSTKDNQQSSEDERTRDSRSCGDDMQGSPSSLSIASDSEGDNQRSDLEVCRDSGEGDPGYDQEGGTSKEAFVHPEDVKTDDLVGSYFALSPSDAIPLDEQMPLLSDDQERGRDEPSAVSQTTKGVEMSGSVRRITKAVDTDNRSRILPCAVSDHEASLSATGEQEATLQLLAKEAGDAPCSSACVVQDRSASETSIPKHTPSVVRCFEKTSTLLVAVLAVGAAAGGVAIWHDPGSPFARATEHAGALVVTTFASTVVNLAYWTKDQLQQSSAAPVVQKLAVPLQSLVKNTSAWSMTSPVYYQSVAADAWNGLKARVIDAMNKSFAVYHALASQVVDMNESVKRYVAARWSEYALGRRLMGEREDYTFTDPLDDERDRMAAIKQQLDRQEAWVLKELQRMKARRVAYSSATEALLSDSKTVISDSIQEAKEAAVRRIKMFHEQIAATLADSTFEETMRDHGDATEVPPYQFDKPVEAKEVMYKQVDVVVYADEERSQPVDSVHDAGQKRTDDAVVAELNGGLLSDEVESVRAEQADDDAIKDDMAAVSEETETRLAATTRRQAGFGDAIDAAADVDKVREELLRIAREEELELEIATASIVSDILETGAEIETEALALHKALEVDRFAGESGAMESVCTDVHCLVDTEATKHICQNVHCAAAAVKQTLEDVDARIGAERITAISGELAKLSAQTTKSAGDQSAAHALIDITSPLPPASDVNATSDSRVANASLRHMVPIAVMSFVFLAMAVVSGLYLRQAWRVRQQRIARRIRWRQRAERKRWQPDDEEEEEPEEVVLMSGPSAGSDAIVSASWENESAQTSSFVDASLDGAGLSAFNDKEDAEHEEPLSVSQSSAQTTASALESSGATLSDSLGVQLNELKRTAGHTAQRALAYSPAISDKFD